MTKQDQQNIVVAFSARFPTAPSRSEVREWMRDVRWVLGLSVGGMNKVYKILDAEMQRSFGVRLL